MSAPIAEFTPKPARYDFLDNAKAIAIVLVVLGHGPALPEQAKAFIYGFHIPLFYFLSGSLLNDKRLGARVSEFLRYIGKSLVVPYVAFFLVSLACWLVLKRVAPQREFSDASVSQAILGLFTGTEESLIVNKVLWFLPCLMVVSAAYYLLRKRLSGKTTAVLALLLAGGACIALPHLSFRLPLGSDCALVALTYYASGHCFRTSGFPMPKTFTAQIAWFSILLPVTVLLSQSNGVVDLSKLNFGRNPLLYLGCAYLGIGMTLSVAASIPATRLMHWLSSSTIVIFPTHPLMFAVFTGAITKLMHLPKEIKDSSVLFTLGYTFLAILLAYPLSKFLKAFFPVILGRK